MSDLSVFTEKQLRDELAARHQARSEYRARLAEERASMLAKLAAFEAAPSPDAVPGLAAIARLTVGLVEVYDDGYDLSTLHRRVANTREALRRTLLG